MGRWVSNFNTTTELQAFSGTTAFSQPHVSLTKDDGKVHFFDPCKSIIVNTTYDWVEIGGVKWATKNVGALTVTDYGQYFQWGDTQGFTADQVSGGCKAFSWADYELGNGGSTAADMTKYNSTDGKTVLEEVDDAATVNMGSGWRIPTTAEFVALGAAVNTAWTANYQGSGVAGMVCTDKTDSSKVLFFPAAGSCSNGSVFDVGSLGNYWSSSLNTGIMIYGSYLGFDNGYVDWHNLSFRFCGFSVRGVVDE
jgi:uncharacterized protein (TIGR02145 family)